MWLVQVLSILKHVATKEKIKAPDALLQRVAQASERNLRRAILMFEASRVAQYVNAPSSARSWPHPALPARALGRYPFSEEQAVQLCDWEVYARETAAKIVQEQTPRRLLEVRTRLYELLTHCIPPDVIIKVKGAPSFAHVPVCPRSP